MILRSRFRFSVWLTVAVFATAFTLYTYVSRKNSFFISIPGDLDKYIGIPVYCDSIRIGSVYKAESSPERHGIYFSVDWIRYRSFNKFTEAVVGYANREPAVGVIRDSAPGQKDVISSYLFVFVVDYELINNVLSQFAKENAIRSSWSIEEKSQDPDSFQLSAANSIMISNEFIEERYIGAEQLMGGDGDSGFTFAQGAWEKPNTNFSSDSIMILGKRPHKGDRMCLDYIDSNDRLIMNYDYCLSVSRPRCSYDASRCVFQANFYFKTKKINNYLLFVERNKNNEWILIRSRLMGYKARGVFE